MICNQCEKKLHKDECWFRDNNGFLCFECYHGDIDKQSNDIGHKLDAGKPRYSLVPPDAMSEFVNVLTYGANKYSDNNWKKVPNLQDRYYDAMQRHVAAFRAGDKLDDESGMHHLAHAMCCLAFMMQADVDGIQQ